MSKDYFGTDGVRGTVGKDPMTADFAMRLASAAAQVLVPQGGTVVIGKDTRLSGYMFESALEAGFVAAGADVLLLGPLPTPGIARLTQEFDADLGVVISASHNAFFDNGIKFFDRSGSKLTDDIEMKIEEHLKNPAITLESHQLGKAKRIDTARIRYQDFCAASMPDGINLEGMKVVFDGANGAGYKVGPRALANLGAEVIPIGCSPNGKNINAGCGSMEPELLQLTVPAVKGNVGVALDGDGDRVVMVDETGKLIDGDQLLYVLAMDRKNNGGLSGPVVGTVMSNLGLEHALQAMDIDFRRAAVGDRYVLETLRSAGGIIGGETSGHMLVLDKTTTGDGLISALQVLAIMKRTGKPLSELVAGMPKYPQTMVNVRTERRLNPDESTAIQDAVAVAEHELADKGRVVLRASGTEPVIRVMVEGEDAEQVVSLAKRLASIVAQAAA
ncbi:MAG: phosphoglucosamine mutase [Gammaproteobacteria bacterium]|jgi:phosphoglucosamine mutase|nr:phosphoglucosamine mutase [Gammaproteobacteria bacterium]MDH3779043.1 phosphoglucosamine mutase [Gammaproteobacteria bacterium]MDH3811398.1 phosphoglucosamine mutase [Gammaproteobacteria bacterium]